MDPYSGGGRKARQLAPQRQATYVRKDEAKEVKKQKPFPPKARRFFMIFAVVLMLLGTLPLALEASGTAVEIGPWLSLAITLPITLGAMICMAFLRDGLVGNLVSGAVVIFGVTMGYALEFELGDEQRAMMMRAAGPVVLLVMLAFFWRSLKTNLRDMHYMIAEGQSMQDIMTRYQQASVIKKSGGAPALDEKGNVIDANELMPKKGFRPKKGATAGKATKVSKGKKRKKPKVR